MVNAGRAVIGVLIILAFVILRISPQIAPVDSPITKFLNSLYITHPFFLIIGLIIGFLIIFSALEVR